MNVSKCESISIVGHYKDLSKKIRKQALEAKFKIDRAIINKVEQVKYLGVVLSQNFQFISHVKHILKKVNAAQAMLYRIFSNKYISKAVKIIMYKQLIRPLITYASPCWLIKNVISSYQIELLRKKERHFLRKCCNIFKNNDNTKYINSELLYREARINRLDREIVKNNLNFVNKSKIHVKQMIRDTVSTNVEDLENLKYKPIDYYNILQNHNRLHENNLFLIFNKKKYKPNENIYVEAQNVNDF